ncbi:15015_t:CDS:2 [Racocetra fulgida]|uniref:15015_t:CDS:1 n=1 Tax=Racocetra fulgida TaxID=60492 RepID=A0A9N9AP38_9GLOM|nr:15015_t:CDS:2 [Racocetra fulgida]
MTSEVSEYNMRSESCGAVKSDKKVFNFDNDEPKLDYDFFFDQVKKSLQELNIREL